MSFRLDVLKKALAIAILSLAVCACSKSPEATGKMLVERMHQLARASVLSLDLIRDTLEVDFVKDEATSHEMVTFFVGKPPPGSPFEGFIKLVDCRAPTERNMVLREPFLVVEIQEAAQKLLAKDLVAALGEPASYRPSLPQDQSASGSYIYKAGSRSLWISLSRRPSEPVREISIHPLADAP
ncbi:MAG: hypothetical protein JXA73_18230 [Acidobacteria bacterium]|nr:hypothetical protein [Acidobacteriota bacterium]